jgi:hypothetical protein
MYTRQRFGLRKGQKTIPWKGASNLSVPLIDKAIRRWKPPIVRLTTESDPVAFFFATKPGDEGNARIAEKFYTWLFKWEMDALESVVVLADMVAQRGVGWIEVGWEYRTDRIARVVSSEDIIEQATIMAQEQEQEPDDSHVIEVLEQQYDLNMRRPDHDRVLGEAVAAVNAGIPRFKMVYRQVVRDRPSLVVHDPIQVILPLRETDEKNAEFVCIQNMMTKGDLLAMARDEMLEQDKVNSVVKQIEDRLEAAKDNSRNDVLGLSSNSDTIREDRDTVDEMIGIIAQHENPENLEVWKVFCWLPRGPGGELVRTVVWYHPSTRTHLANMDFVFPFFEWPLKRFDFEKTYTKRVLASRGIPALLSDLQMETNKLRNARLDAIDIQLAPVFLVRSTGNYTRTLRWAPGTGFPVQHPEDVRPLVQDLRNIQMYTAEENDTRVLAEDFIGIFDATLGGPTGGDRTATEIEAVQAQISGVFSLDATLWQKGWRDVHGMVFHLWLELGDKKTFIRVAGTDGPVQVLKHEINRNFDIRPAGTPSSTNKAMELARAREAMQIFWNPMSIQTGLIDMQKLAGWYLSSQDHNRAQTIVRSPEQAAEQQTILQAAQMINQGGLDEVMSRANSVKGQQAGRNAR